MSSQSEAALENGLIATLQKMNYEYVHIEEEKNPTTYNLARMNMLLHGIKFSNFRIEKKNYVDAIIGLPANIFYGTSIPTCILVFKKCRKEDDNILFIDASKEFEKVKTQNKLRPQHIKKIVDTYRDRKEIEKYFRRRRAYRHPRRDEGNQGTGSPTCRP